MCQVETFGLKYLINKENLHDWGYLYTLFLPQWDPSVCPYFFPYLALSSPFFRPSHHTVSIPLLFFSHAAFLCCSFFSPFIISVENKSCRMSTSQHRKGSTHFPFFSLRSSDFLPKLLATNAGIVPDVLKLSHLALKSYWDRNVFTAEHSVLATQYIWFWDACEMCFLIGLDRSAS